eukprot:5056749-Pleurochrysis_carterae.AAC.2
MQDSLLGSHTIATPWEINSKVLPQYVALLHVVAEASMWLDFRLRFVFQKCQTRKKGDVQKLRHWQEQRIVSFVAGESGDGTAPLKQHCPFAPLFRLPCHRPCMADLTCLRPRIEATAKSRPAPAPALLHLPMAIGIVYY